MFRRLIQRAALALALTAITLACLELGSCAVIETGMLDATRPRYGRDRYWTGDHPEFGAWRLPNAKFEHRTACFQVDYHTNSVGARDVERPRSGPGRRVLVLGDSFMEGWGISLEQRLSNLLENATGLPHLNFAMSTFGPYQEYLLYRSLAVQYAHDAVLVGLFPTNDFRDLDLEIASELLSYSHRYRPYLVERSGRYERFDYRESRLQRVLREYSYTYNAFLPLAAELRSRLGLPSALARHEPEPPLSQSWFYDFDLRQLALLERILTMLMEEARGKRVAVLLIPAEQDLERYRQSGPDPLSARLRELAGEQGFLLVNLLPRLAENERLWTNYFFPCDYHWNALGNRVAFHYVLAELRGFYGRD